MKLEMFFFVMVMVIMKAQKYFYAAEQAFNPIIYLQFGSLSSGDYDNDGKLDIVCGGISVVGASFVLYHQNMSLNFFDVNNAVTFPNGLPPGFFSGRVVFV